MVTLIITLLWSVAGILGLSLVAGEAYGLLAFSWIPSVVCFRLGNRIAREPIAW